MKIGMAILLNLQNQKDFLTAININNLRFRTKNNLSRYDIISRTVNKSDNGISFVHKRK